MKCKSVNPSLKVTKRGFVNGQEGAQYRKGDQIYYTFEVENTGDVDLSDISLTDNMLAGRSVQIPVNQTTLAPQAKVTFTSASFNATDKDVSDSKIDNDVTVNAKGGGKDVSGTSRYTLTAAKTNADFSFTKKVLYVLDSATNEKKQEYNNINDQVFYEFHLHNSGDVALENIKITDTVIGDVNFASPYQGGVVPRLDVEGDITVNASYRVQAKDLDAGSIVNVASAKPASPANAPTREATATVTGKKPRMEVTIVKEGRDGSCQAGSVQSTFERGTQICYYYTVTNTGDVPIYNVAVDDNVLGRIETADGSPIAPGLSRGFSRIYTATQDDVNKGVLRNIAVVTSKLTDGGAEGPKATSNEIVINGIGKDSLSITKSATINGTPHDTTYQKNDKIRWYFEVTNTGAFPVKTSDLVINDPLLAELKLSPPQLIEGEPVLQPGKSAKFASSNYDVQPADLARQELRNTASVTGISQHDGRSIGPYPSNTVILTPDLKPVLTLTKTGTIGGSATAKYVEGSEIDYVFTLTNKGNVDLTGVYLVDDMLGYTKQKPLNVGTIAAEGSVKLSGKYTAKADDVTRGSVHNVATGYGFYGDNRPIPDPPSDDDTRQADQSRYDFTLQKKAAVTGGTADNRFTAAGQQIVYTLTVTNKGNAPIADVTISDTDLEGLDWPSGNTIASIAAGESKSVTAVYTVKLADLDRGRIDNTASATAKKPDGRDVDGGARKASATVYGAGAASVTIQKSGKVASASGRYNAGDSITYTMTVTNSGDVTLKNIRVTDTLEDNGGVLSVSPASLATLEPGHTAEFTASYTAKQADMDRGSITNRATVDAEDPAGRKVPQQEDRFTVHADTKSSLSIVKSVTVDGKNVQRYALGSKIVYYFTVENTGNVAVENINITDSDLIDGLAIKPAAKTTLKPKETVKFETDAYVAQQKDIDAGSITNANAVAKGRQAGSGEAVSSPPSNAVTITADRQAALSLTKNGSVVTKRADGRYQAGDRIDYSFTVTNKGDVTLNNITIADAFLPAGTVYEPASIATLSPHESAGITAQYVATAADVEKGSIVNTATAHSKLPDGSKGPVSDPASKTLLANQEASLTLTKVGTVVGADSQGRYSKVGQRVNYELTVTNTGTISLTNVVVKDPNLTFDADNTIAVLAAGTTKKLTGYYSIKAEDIDRGSFTNTARAFAKAEFADKAERAIEAPEASYTVNANQMPGLVTTKTASVKGRSDGRYEAVGDVIEYRITVRNSGNIVLKDITPRDAMLTDKGITLVAEDKGRAAQLAPEESVTFTASYPVTQADLDAGKVVNVAGASATPPVDSPDTDEVVTPAKINPEITLVKTGSVDDGAATYDSVGDTITYQFVLHNKGNVTLHGVSVVDRDLPVTVSPAQVETLAPGDDAVFEAHYTVKSEDLDRGFITNIASGSATRPDGGAVGPVDSNKVTIAASQMVQLELEKKGTITNREASAYLSGDTITYSFTVTNRGNVTMRDIRIVDAMFAADGAITPASVAVLNAGDTASFTATYQAVQADVDRGSIINHATVTATGPDGNPLADPPEAEHRIDADARAEAKIIKTGLLEDANENGVGESGETVTYGFEIENTGNVTLRDIHVADEMLVAAGVVTEPASIASLAPGDKTQFTATYPLSQKDAAGVMLSNTAHGEGQLPGEGGTYRTDPSTVDIGWAVPSTLEVAKSGTFNDVDNNGFSTEGDTIAYVVTITNDGGQTAENVRPVDQGVLIGGKPGTGKLSDFEPKAPVTLGPGESRQFTAVYTLTDADVQAAAQDEGHVVNTATASGQAGQQSLPATVATATVVLPKPPSSDISVVKTASVRTIHRGENAPFAIIVSNSGQRAQEGLVLVDRMPAGFRYVKGSATINDEAVTPEVAGREIRFKDLRIAPDEELVIRLQITPLITVGPGTYTNIALALDGTGTQLAAPGSASVEIAVDPVFDCGDIIGKVFEDQNGDGYADQGETGLPGVRLATVTGTLITTDPHGRFHIACADLPDQQIGSNFILKLDERSLPKGYHVTTENPRVIRLTAGKMAKINFGAKGGTVIELTMTDDAFTPDSDQLQPQWEAGLDQLIQLMRQKPEAMVKIDYQVAANGPLQKARAKAITKAMEQKWKSAGGKKKVDVMLRVEIRRP
ncbi:DUF7507 domain-containing protein [Martelella alba]|uniref:DUF7507 domain-containing protein n=1 Tax=Martelella alba TaxID=2590451 RepID=UPI0015E868E3|nr:DUF11 domain-containing protein [Martelella alba]